MLRDQLADAIRAECSGEDFMYDEATDRIVVMGKKSNGELYELGCFASKLAYLADQSYMRYAVSKIKFGKR